MTVLTTYLLAFHALFLGADPGVLVSGDPGVQPGEWLLIENLQLQLNGPCYDVAFFQDDILFMKSGEEVLHRVPLSGSGPGNSQPLFLNRDISCSPAAISFSKDYSKAYCTRALMGRDQLYSEKIFELSIEGKQVTGLSQLPFSGDPSRNLHPALSEDGSMIVFASDRLPTNGGLDLFLTRRTTAGWSEPVNLGQLINTSGHEWFPFLDRRNNLWFSSTGHSGYGGFDIYLCPYNEGEWGRPMNLGTAINGPQNELGFSVHPQRELALFSRTWLSEDRGAAIMISLNVEALDAAEINEAAARDIILLIQSMADPFTGSGTVTEPEPELEPPATGDQDPVVFRIQIISSLYENSFPTVLIDGQSYSTYEYFYLGSYRITVGEFYSLDEANVFRTRCLDSGFKQAFVAAFRGGERVTDPEVFKQ